MPGSFLRFYVHEGLKHRHDAVSEWLLMQANKLGIRGGSAFKAMAGFGRHHKMTEDKFFDMGASGVEIEFIVTEEEATQLLELIRQEKLSLFYAKVPARFGVIDPDASEPPSIISKE
jgi:PII-like signaling protein